ncbi:MAG: MerR family DNA-binding protein [Xenococcaceae cyanobacterium MO_167.B27]|nr:MerR family DNA-binding protein [Xenococcaceae cyanobacterium MO_167.B27]
MSKKTGLSKDTIRFYEKIGLITASERKAGKRIYKEFNQETIERIFMINQGKKLGFKLKEIRLLLDEWGNASMPKHEQIKIIESKLEEVEEKMQQLTTIKNYLAAKLSKLQEDVS